MQKHLPKRVKTVSLKLERIYGKKKLRVHNDPLSELIATILSQNTSDHNSHRAYSNLISRFRTWDRVRKASWQRVADTIRSGGLADIKAQRIKNVLNQIYKENRRLDLDFLKKWETDKIKTYLRRFTGVGEKTIACVLLFSMKRPVMPVDTHVLRVSRRLGLVPPRADAKKAQAFLEKLVPGKQIYQFHLSLIQHGREVCKASNPRCDGCVLLESCDYGRRALGL